MSSSSDSIVITVQEPPPELQIPILKRSVAVPYVEVWGTENGWQETPTEENKK